MTRLRLSGFRCRLLQPIDLELIPGQCLTLSGPSGSGKSYGDDVDDITSWE